MTSECHLSSKASFPQRICIYYLLGKFLQTYKSHITMFRHSHQIHYIHISVIKTTADITVIMNITDIKDIYRVRCKYITVMKVIMDITVTGHHAHHGRCGY